MLLIKDDFARKPDLQLVEAKSVDEIFEEQKTRDTRVSQSNIQPGSIKSSHLGLEYIYYTPRWTGASANPSIGNGTLKGKYIRTGPKCDVHILISWGSTTSSGTGYWTISVPFRSKADDIYDVGVAQGYNSSIQHYGGVAFIAPSSTTMVIAAGGEGGGSANAWGGTVPFTFGTGDRLDIYISYEVADTL